MQAYQIMYNKYNNEHSVSQPISQKKNIKYIIIFNILEISEQYIYAEGPTFMPTT